MNFSRLCSIEIGKGQAFFCKIYTELYGKVWGYQCYSFYSWIEMQSKLALPTKTILQSEYRNFKAGGKNSLKKMFVFELLILYCIVFS